MKHNVFIYYFVCILLICLIKYSYEQDDDDDFDIKYVVNTEAVGWIYDQIGIIEDIIPKLTEKGKTNAKKFIKSRIKKGIADMFKVQKEESACSPEEQLKHAKISALINNNRDPNNRGLTRETVYMFLSHFVDIPVGAIGDTCDANDEGPYYENWITDDDREAYENFIRVINGAKAVEEYINLLDIAKDAKGKLEDYQKEIIEKGVFNFFRDKFKKYAPKFIKDFGSSLIAGKTPSEYFKEKCEEFAEHFEFIDEDTPEDEVISAIQERLSKDFVDSESLDCVSDAFSASFETAIGSVSPITTAITIAKLPLLFLTTLAPKAAVAGMIYSLSGRVAGRVMRVIEEDDDW